MTDDEIHNRFAALENRVTGLEMALAEVAFYAHDVGMGEFHKEVLAIRLIALAEQTEEIFGDRTIAQQVAFPLHRLALALKRAGRSDQNGNPVHGEPA